MKTNWKEWLTIGSNIAILIGILLVFSELQQNRTLARAELTSESFLARMEYAGDLINELAVSTLAKACLNPDELTTEDKIVLSQIFQIRLLSANRTRITEQVSELDLSSDTNLRAAFRAMFNYQYGREYFARMKEYAGEQASDIIEAGERELSENRQSDCSLGSVIPGGF